MKSIEESKRKTGQPLLSHPKKHCKGTSRTFQPNMLLSNILSKRKSGLDSGQGDTGYVSIH